MEINDMTIPAWVAEALGKMDMHDRAEILDALLLHLLKGEEPTFGGYRMAAYLMARHAVDEELY